jgi:type VI protein secretion system component Hcp
MNQTGDLLMKFVLNNKPIEAESLTDLTSTSKVPNPLMEGFTSGQCFEIDNFKFRAGTAGDGKVRPSTPTKTESDSTGKTEKISTPPHSGAREDYQTWRAGGNRRYPVDLKPISFERSIESSSALLIQSCIDCVYFDSATLIKRKPTGSAAAGEAYLRLDFTGVLVTGVDWSDGDEVKETCTFICRGVTIGYRPQLPNGSLGAVTSGFWSVAPGVKQVTYR